MWLAGEKYYTLPIIEVYRKHDSEKFFFLKLQIFWAVFGQKLKITLGAKTMPALHFFQKVRLSYEKITKNAQLDQFSEWTFSVWLFD